MSRLGDCLTAEPSIESARRGIRSAVSDGAIRARHVFLAACASPPSGVMCAHEDRLLFACGHAHNYLAPSNLGAWDHTRFPRLSTPSKCQPSPSKARGKIVRREPNPLGLPALSRRRQSHR